MFALLINASILILAAATFYKAGKTRYRRARSGAFVHRAAARLGDCADLVRHCVAVLRAEFDGDRDALWPDRDGRLSRHSPAGWARRLITRAIAIVPAAIVTIWFGEKGSAQLLILSQVILSLQLPFAIVPLVMFTADRSKMGALVAPRWVTALAVITAAVIIALNIKLLVDFALGSG